MVVPHLKRGWGIHLIGQGKMIRGVKAGAVLLAGLSWSVAAIAGQQPACDAPAALVRFAHPLPHVALKLANRQPVVIVAIGSSSTAGAGASSKAANYPSRLAFELKRRFPDQTVTVINRGVNGEVITDMLRRFDKAVVAMKPDLVLWQLGTNSVLRNRNIDRDGIAIRQGLARIRATGADVVLIDPQFAPKVIVRPDAEHMVSLISETAKAEDADLFRRFALMKRWREHDRMAFESFLSRDGLHMNDWSYACMAKGLGAAIAEAATRPTVEAATGPVTAAAVDVSP